MVTADGSAGYPGFLAGPMGKLLIRVPAFVFAGIQIVKGMNRLYIAKDDHQCVQDIQYLFNHRTG